MKTNKGTYILRFLILVFLLPTLTLKGQENTEEIEVLVLTNVKTNKTVQIKSARKVKIMFEDDVELRGRLQDVRNDSIVVNNQLIGLDRIKKIRISSTGAKIIGGTILGGGLIIAGTGIAIIATAHTASGCLGPLAATITGIFVTGAGGLVSLIALPIFLIGKKFDLTKNWRVSTALVAE